MERMAIYEPLARSEPRSQPSRRGPTPVRFWRRERRAALVTVGGRSEASRTLSFFSPFLRPCSTQQARQHQALCVRNKHGSQEGAEARAGSPTSW